MTSVFLQVTWEVDKRGVLWKPVRASLEEMHSSVANIRRDLASHTEGEQ